MRYSNRFEDRTVVIYRVVLLLLSVISLVVMHYERFVTGEKFILYDLQFFTTITNYFVMFWLVLFFFWRDQEDKLNKLSGSIKGALTTYMIIVALVYIVLIAADHDPEGLFILTNYLHHYIIPPLFVLDTLLFSSTRYEYTWILSWLFYPVLYLVYAMIIAQTTNFYVYFFLNLNLLTWVEFFMWIGIMLSLFVIFGSIFVALNRLLVKEDQRSASDKSLE